jgi:hypothetical protein
MPASAIAAKLDRLPTEGQYSTTNFEFSTSQQAIIDDVAQVCAPLGDFIGWHAIATGTFRKSFALHLRPKPHRGPA